MEPPQIQVLSDDEMRKIDETSRDILEDVGIKIKSREVLNELEEKGLIVDYDHYTVKFDPGIVQDAIDATPEKFEIFGRDKTPSFGLGGKYGTRFASGFNAIYIHDYHTGNRRPMMKNEFAEFAKLSNYLREIDIVGPQAMPQDVPATSALLHAVEAVLNSTVKPMLFSPESDREVTAVIEMIKVVIDGEKIGSRPIGICQFSPSSLLFWNEGTVKGFKRIAREGFPCTILPGPLAGATSPYTLAANLVQKNCEVLSGVVIALLMNRGTPLLVYNGGGQFEMRSMTAVLGTPEMTTVMMAGNQLARFYKIPTHACIPCSDSHCPDQQVGIENMMLIFAGMFASGETASFEQLIIDNEIIKMTRRIVKGIQVNEDTICSNTIKKIGPMGNFISDDTTLQYLLDMEWSTSRILGREKHALWEQGGRKTILERAGEVLNEMRRLEDVPLNVLKRREIERIIRGYEKGSEQ